MISTFFIISAAGFLIGFPIAFTMGFSSIVYTIMAGMPSGVVIQRLFAGIDRAPLMAIPFFILAGELMNQGGIAKRLVALANAMVGNMYGSLGIVTVASCMFFSAISGSAIAVAASIGTIMIPVMVKANYDREFATAIIATTSPIGAIIPPSITFITFGVLTGTSITELYLAGIPSGIIMGILMFAYVYIIARKNKIRTQVQKTTMKEKLLLLRNAVWAIGAPVILLGGVFSGLFTPTESAVIAVVYSLIVGLFIYKDLTLKETYQIFVRSAVGTARIMLIIATATLFAYIMTFERVPQGILEGLGAITENKILTLLLINLILLAMGTFMDTTAIIIITVPLLWPIITKIGIDPVHFGLIVTVNTAIGFVTPPIGVCLFTAASVGQVQVERLSKAVLLPICFLITGLIIITYFPQSMMFLVGR